MMYSDKICLHSLGMLLVFQPENLSSLSFGKNFLKSFCLSFSSHFFFLQFYTSGILFFFFFNSKLFELILLFSCYFCSPDLKLLFATLLISVMLYEINAFFVFLSLIEGWAPKNWCFWTVVLEKTPESPLDCKEIQPVHSEEDQPWDFFGGNDAEAETPVLWPPHEKTWLIGKDSNAGRYWGQEEKGTPEDEMAGWHHWLDGLESEWTPGVCDGQGGLACCGSWGHKELDMTEWLNWTELVSKQAFISISCYVIIWNNFVKSDFQFTSSNVLSPSKSSELKVLTTLVLLFYFNFRKKFKLYLLFFTIWANILTVETLFWFSECSFLL